MDSMLDANDVKLLIVCRADQSTLSYFCFARLTIPVIYHPSVYLGQAQPL